jgi:hypothetical protein
VATPPSLVSLYLQEEYFAWKERLFTECNGMSEAGLPVCDEVVVVEDYVLAMVWVELCGWHAVILLAVV